MTNHEIAFELIKLIPPKIDNNCDIVGNRKDNAPESYGKLVATNF